MFDDSYKSQRFCGYYAESNVYALHIIHANRNRRRTGLSTAYHEAHSHAAYSILLILYTIYHLNYFYLLLLHIIVV